MAMKKLISVVISIVMIMCTISVGSFSSVQAAEISAPQFVESNKIYALGFNTSKEAWQCWEDYESGLYSEAGVKYFFLPEKADAKNLTVYNSYNSDVTLNGVTVKANSSGEVPYVKGEKATAVCRGKTYTYVVLTSDSDASIYVNDTKNDYTNGEGKHFTDFYEFLIDNKENSVKDSDIAVVSQAGLTETKLKKFKGRGNTNWYKSEKKQFNLTFNDTVNIGGIDGKKFSLINNGRDGSFIRGRVVFDVANEVGLPYSSDTRYIDLYINGSYRGCFQISKKVEMGKSQLISLKDTSEDEGVVDNFNFAVEIDIWNAANDTNFTSKYGQTIALNTPELEDYNTDAVQKAQMNFIQSKYAEFEDALYKGNMASLEKICDVELLAKAYLIQEWTKNCDGGLTSTYYTYDASTGKFQAAPVWDFDSGLGNVDCERSGAERSTVYPDGWLTKYVKNDNGRSRYVNTLGQAFNLSGKTSEGKTFADYVKEVWKNDFIPAIKVAVGQADSTGSRLKSMDQYVSEYQNAFYNNYVIWGFEWGPEKGLGYEYPYSYQGQVDYLNHWTIARTNWMTKELLGESGELLTEPEKPTYPSTSVEDNASFYLVGTLADVNNWDTRDYPLVINETRTKATIDLTLEKGKKYRFKVAKVINNDRREHYVADYDLGVTSQYFYADESTANLNVMAKHTETVTLTLVFDIYRGLFAAYPQGQVPSDPVETEPSESTVPTETTTDKPAESESTDTTATEPSESTVPTESESSQPTVTEPSETTETEAPVVTEKPENTEPTTKPVAKKTTITLKKSSATIYLKGSVTIVAAVKNGKGKTTYTSSDKKIATVNSKGKVVGKKAGTVKITVENNGVKKIFKLTVKKPVLNKKTKTLKKNKSFTLKIKGQVGKAEFKSTNKKVATVNSKGKVVAKKKGRATIKVKTNGITLKCVITVK